MKYIKLILLAAVAVLALSSCKQEISTTLYVRDIIDTLESDDPLATSATIKLGMSSVKSCEEKKEKLTKVILPFFSDVKKIQCVKDGSNTFYSAVFQLPLFKTSDMGDLSKDYNGGVSAQFFKNEKGHVAIYLSMKIKLLNSLDKDLREEFRGSGGIDPDDLKILVTINNDERVTYELYVEGAFLDGIAIISSDGQTLDLDRREESVVSLSDVSVFALTGKGRTSFAYVGSIRHKQEEKTVKSE